MSEKLKNRKSHDQLGPFGVSQAVVFGDSDSSDSSDDEGRKESYGSGAVDALMSAPVSVIGAQEDRVTTLGQRARQLGYVQMTYQPRLEMGEDGAWTKRYTAKQIAGFPIFQEIQSRQGLLARTREGTFLITKVSEGNAAAALVLPEEGKNSSGAFNAIRGKFKHLDEEGEFELPEESGAEFSDSESEFDEAEESAAEAAALPAPEAALPTAHNVLDVIPDVEGDFIEAFDESGALLVKRAEAARDYGMSDAEMVTYLEGLSPEDREAFEKSHAFFGLTNKIKGGVAKLRAKSTRANTKAELKAQQQKAALKQAKMEQKMLLEAQKKRAEASLRAYQKAAQKEAAKQAKLAEKEGSLSAKKAVAAMEAQRRAELAAAERELAETEASREASKQELEEARGEIGEREREIARQRAERKAKKAARTSESGSAGEEEEVEESEGEEEEASFGSAEEHVYLGPLRNAVIGWSAVRPAKGGSPMVTGDTSGFYKELNPQAAEALHSSARADALSFLESAGFSGGVYYDKAKSVMRIDGRTPIFTIYESATTPEGNGTVLDAEDWNPDGSFEVTEETLVAPGDKASMAKWSATVAKDGVLNLIDPATNLRSAATAESRTRMDHGRVMIVPQGGSKADARVWRIESSPSYSTSKGHARKVTIVDEKLDENDPYRYGRGLLYGAEHSNADGSITVDTMHLLAVFGEMPDPETIDAHTVPASELEE